MKTWDLKFESASENEVEGGDYKVKVVKCCLVGGNGKQRIGIKGLSFVCWHMRIEMDESKVHSHSIIFILLKMWRKGENEQFDERWFHKDWRWN